MMIVHNFSTLILFANIFVDVLSYYRSCMLSGSCFHTTVDRIVCIELSSVIRSGHSLNISPSLLWMARSFLSSFL